MIKSWECLQCTCISTRTGLLGLKVKNTWKLYHWVHTAVIFMICQFLLLSVTERWNWNCLWPKVKMVDWCGVVHLERYVLDILGIVKKSIIRNYSSVDFSFSTHTSPKCLPSENPLWQQTWGRISIQTRSWPVTFSKAVFCWYCCRILVLFFQEIQWNYISIFSLLLLECRYDL